MKKISINMLSKADSVDGQGVGSAYLEQVALVKECDDLFDVSVNGRGNKYDIVHVHNWNGGYDVEEHLKAQLNYPNYYLKFYKNTLFAFIKEQMKLLSLIQYL